MAGYGFDLAGERLVARGSGALWWPEARALVVSDLHLGKSERLARRGGTLLPPYEGRETLGRLDAEVAALAPATVVCLGDSFDDLAAAEEAEEEVLWLARLAAGRRWIWIAGNHDPGPLALSGEHLGQWEAGRLRFRHSAEAGTEAGEVSGHYHPKAALPGGRARPCFLIDGRRAVLPAFGAYTGGLRCSDPALDGLMAPGALAVLTGPHPLAFPMPRGREAPPRPRRRGGCG